MRRGRSKENVDLSGLHQTGISFEISNGKISIFNVRALETNVLAVKEKSWRKTISGRLFGRNTIKIEAVGKKHLSKSLLSTMLAVKKRSPDRIINVNGKKIGVLKDKRRDINWLIQPCPLRHFLDCWETLYYYKTTRSVLIMNKGKLFAAAEFNEGVYRLLVSEDDSLLLCLALSLASIDALDNRYMQKFAKKNAIC